MPCAALRQRPFNRLNLLFHSKRSADQLDLPELIIRKIPRGKS